MAHRQGHGRSTVALLALVLLTGLLPTASAARAADEVGPSAPVELPRQPGTPNTVDAVRPVPPADVISAAAGGGPAVDPGTERVEPPAQAAPDEPTDVAERRTEFSSTVANPDGTFTVTQTGERQHFQDAEGAWQPIDTTLVADAVDGFTLRTRANDRVVRVDETPRDGLVAVLEADGHRIRLIAPGATGASLDPDANAVVVAIDGRVPLILEPTPEGLEFSFRLADRSSARTLEVVVDPDGLTAGLARDGRTVELRDASGVVQAAISAPITFDAAGVTADPELTGLTIVDGAEPAPTPDPTPEPVPLVVPSAPPEASPAVSPSASVEPSATAESSPTPSPIPLPTPEASLPPPSESAPPSAPPAPSPSPTPTVEPSRLPSPTPSAVPTPTPSATASPVPTPMPSITAGPVTLRYAIADAWLDDLARVYPVTLDPTVVTIQGDGSGAYDCDAAVGSPSAFDDWIGQVGNPLCSSEMRIGYDATHAILRGLFWFESVALGSGSWADDGQQIRRRRWCGGPERPVERRPPRHPRCRRVRDLGDQRRRRRAGRRQRPRRPR